MKKYKIVSKNTEEEIERICNCCGLSYSIYEQNYEEWQWDSISPFKIYFGYGDPSDGETFKFDICDKCMHEWIDSFKIKPEIIATNLF